MRATVKVDLASFGTNKPPIAEGTEVEVVSTHQIYHVKVEQPDGSMFRTDIPARLLRIECEHPDCTEEADPALHLTKAPAHWCRPHWTEWITDVRGQDTQPGWMKGTP